MKGLMDRCYAMEQELQNKAFYLLSTGLASEESYFNIIKNSFQKYIDCFRAGGNYFAGYIFGYQTSKKDDIEKSKAIKNAYEMGQGI